MAAHYIHAGGQSKTTAAGGAGPPPVKHAAQRKEIDGPSGKNLYLDAPEERQRALKRAGGRAGVRRDAG